ncbi:hypothetical protein SAMN05444679_1485 [Variovorax sp. CF079]|uniref:hypothetical protein n=1 Tax=Variovorax sp. CF079 TaxID=1882774 RepID=UPI000888A03F|nr:hypothetical protein [Variovorax sp. CF079]SDE97361.1 hypothetical protein SAMN05444679_1485 [Variovorax sp. CF079]
MQALEVLRNGQTVVMAGASDALMISLHLTILVDGEYPATLHIGGMRDLGNDRQSHVQWIEDLALADGDELRIRLLSVPEASTPVEDVPADSEEHLAAQAQYERELASNPPQPRKLERRRPNASLELTVGVGQPIVANFGVDGELLMLGGTWNNWHPERWRLSLSSCSCEQALARQGGKDRFNGRVARNEVVIVRVRG